MKGLGLVLIFAASFMPLPAVSKAPPPAGMPNLHEGDIVFIRSASAQAPAIAEVMGSSWTHVGVAVMRDSKWFIAETAATVSLTPPADFLGKSRDGEFIVKRLKKWASRPAKNDLARLKEWLFSNIGKKYDIYFEWSDAALYCSEYVWKAYYSALPEHPALSKPQKFSELNVTGPLARQLIDKRYKAAGKNINMDELIVTPVALLNSGLLLTVPH